MIFEGLLMLDIQVNVWEKIDNHRGLWSYLPSLTALTSYSALLIFDIASTCLNETT
jgi:hypothetical protein